MFDHIMGATAEVLVDLWLVFGSCASHILTFTSTLTLIKANLNQRPGWNRTPFRFHERSNCSQTQNALPNQV